MKTIFLTFCMVLVSITVLGQTEEEAGDYAEDLAATMLATTRPRTASTRRPKREAMMKIMIRMVTIWLCKSLIEREC